MNSKNLVVMKAIKKLEQDIYKQKEKLARLRIKLTPVEIPDYELKNSLGKTVKLSELFGKKDELIMIHNMGTGCPYCTLWADGFNGELKHLENRAAFVVESANTPQVQKRFAKSRGWKFKMVSSHDLNFKSKLGFASKDGSPIPGASTFLKKKGKVYLASQTVFGPGDNFCSVWDLFDLLPKGVNGWEAKFKY